MGLVEYNPRDIRCLIVMRLIYVSGINQNHTSSVFGFSASADIVPGPPNNSTKPDLFRVWSMPCYKYITRSTLVLSPSQAGNPPNYIPNNAIPTSFTPHSPPARTIKLT